MIETIYPEAEKFSLIFNKGVHSSDDPTVIPPNSLAQGVNIDFTRKSHPTQCLGQQRYNLTVIAPGQPVKGGGSFIGEDGLNYILIACNSRFYWSNGNGVFTAVTYKNDATAVAINTDSFWYNFQEFWDSTSGTQKKIVFCVTNSYPIVTNSNGTHAANCTTARALYFYVAAGVVYAKNIFYNTAVALDTMTATTGWTAGNNTPTIALNTTANQSAGSNGGVKMSATTISGLIDMYKTYVSFSVTGKLINVDLYPDTLANVDYVYIRVESAATFFSEFRVTVTNLTAASLQVLTFDMTDTPSLTGGGGPASLGAIVKVTLGVHTTAAQTVNYTYSLLIVTAAGSDDVQVGSQANTPPDASWPQQGRYICRIFDKILVANSANFTNGYTVSQARNGLNWTNPTGSIDIGGGTTGEPFTMVLAYNTSVLMWTRHGILNVNATPGDLSTWREQWLQTNLGNVGQQVSINNDGWVYYISEEGLCRTDGRIAERCDMTIENNTTQLAQLLQNSFDLTLDQSSDWKAGSVIGANQIETNFPQLQQDVQDTQAQWQAGPNTPSTLSNIDFTSFPNAVTIAAINGTSNISLSKPATAVGSAPDHVFPSGGNSGPRVFGNPAWYGFSKDTTYWQCDLQGFYKIDILTADVWFPDGFPVSYVLQTSVDGINFVTWASGQTAQFIRLQVLSNNFSGSPRIALSNLVAGSFVNTTTAFITTQTIDYAVTPTTYGNMIANVSLSPAATGMSIDFYSQVSPDDLTWSIPLLLGTAANGTIGNVMFALPPPTQRYLRIKAVLNKTSQDTYRQVLYAIAVGGQWVSATEDLTATPTAYGVFNSSVNLNNQSIKYEMDTSVNSNFSSPDGFKFITPSTIPANTVRRYVRFRVTFNVLDVSSVQPLPSILPQLQSLSLANFQGGNQNILPSVFCWNDRVYVALQMNNSLIGTNDTLWVGETRPNILLDWTISPTSGMPYPQWSMRDFVQATCFFIYKNKIVSGDSVNGFVNWQETGNINCGAITDDFDRPANNLTLGICTTGQTWTYGTAGGGGDTDIFGITAIQTAYCVNANFFDHIRTAVIDSALANCNVSSVIPVMNPNQGMVFRYIDDNNYLAVFVGSAITPGQSEYFFRTVVTGVVTDTVPGAIGNASSGDQIRMYLNGTKIILYVNGNAIYSTIVTNVTGTKHGLYMAGTGYITSTWEEFAVNYINAISIDYTSFIVTKALTADDADLLARFFYLYYSADSEFKVAWRTRKNEDDWSLWSDDQSINEFLGMVPSQNVSRLMNVMPGIVEGMAIQFRISQTGPDPVWSVEKMSIYANIRSIGR